jgi:hypothetical protein
MNQNTKVREKAFEITFDKSDKYVYQPAQPFRLSGILVWEPNGDIISLAINNVEQFVDSRTNLQYFKTLFSIDQARAAIKHNVMNYWAPDHLKGLLFQTCNPQHTTTITIQGSFKEIMFWGD